MEELSLYFQDLSCISPHQRDASVCHEICLNFGYGGYVAVTHTQMDPGIDPLRTIRILRYSQLLKSAIATRDGAIFSLCVSCTEPSFMLPEPFSLSASLPALHKLAHRSVTHTGPVSDGVQASHLIVFLSSQTSRIAPFQIIGYFECCGLVLGVLFTKAAWFTFWKSLCPLSLAGTPVAGTALASDSSYVLTSFVDF